MCMCVWNAQIMEHSIAKDSIYATNLQRMH